MKTFPAWLLPILTDLAKLVVVSLATWAWMQLKGTREHWRKVSQGHVQIQTTQTEMQQTLGTLTALVEGQRDLVAGQIREAIQPLTDRVGTMETTFARRFKEVDDLVKDYRSDVHGIRDDVNDILVAQHGELVKLRERVTIMAGWHIDPQDPEIQAQAAALLQRATQDGMEPHPKLLRAPRHARRRTTEEKP